MNWISIQERFPEEACDDVLGYYEVAHATGVYSMYDIFRYENKKFLYFDDEWGGYYEQRGVTHWRLLEPPFTDSQCGDKWISDETTWCRFPNGHEGPHEGAE